MSHHSQPRGKQGGCDRTLPTYIEYGPGRATGFYRECREFRRRGCPCLAAASRPIVRLARVTAEDQPPPLARLGKISAIRKESDYASAVFPGRQEVAGGAAGAGGPGRGRLAQPHGAAELVLPAP